MLEDGEKQPPAADYPPFFADAIDLDPTAFPILADPAKGIAAAANMNPKAVPGKIVLAPDMRIVGTYVGADDDEGFAMIVADAQ